VQEADKQEASSEMYQKSAYSIEMPFGRMDADLWSVGAACFCQKTYACGVGGRRSRGSSQMSRTFSVAL